MGSKTKKKSEKKEQEMGINLELPSFTGVRIQLVYSPEDYQLFICPKWHKSQVKLGFAHVSIGAGAKLIIQQL